mgnify:CR=1 FL=1
MAAVWCHSTVQREGGVVWLAQGGQQSTGDAGGRVWFLVRNCADLCGMRHTGCIRDVSVGTLPNGVTYVLLGQLLAPSVCVLLHDVCWMLRWVSAFCPYCPRGRAFVQPACVWSPMLATACVLNSMKLR